MKSLDDAEETTLVTANDSFDYTESPVGQAWLGEVVEVRDLLF